MFISGTDVTTFLGMPYVTRIQLLSTLLSISSWDSDVFSFSSRIFCRDFLFWCIFYFSSCSSQFSLSFLFFCSDYFGSILEVLRLFRFTSSLVSMVFKIPVGIFWNEFSCALRVEIDTVRRFRNRFIIQVPCAGQLRLSIATPVWTSKSPLKLLLQYYYRQVLRELDIDLGHLQSIPLYAPLSVFLWFGLK